MALKLNVTPPPEKKIYSYELTALISMNFSWEQDVARTSDEFEKWLHSDACVRMIELCRHLLRMVTDSD